MYLLSIADIVDLMDYLDFPDLDHPDLLDLLDLPDLRPSRTPGSPCTYRTFWNSETFTYPGLSRPPITPTHQTFCTIWTFWTFRTSLNSHKYFNRNCTYLVLTLGTLTSPSSIWKDLFTASIPPAS